VTRRRPRDAGSREYTHERLLAEQNGPVLTVTIQRPPRNFFDEKMAIELDQLTKALRHDKSVRAVIFRGAGDTYITHFDVPSLLAAAERAPFPVGFRTARAIAAAARLVPQRRPRPTGRRGVVRDALFMARTYAALGRLSRLDKVVIAEINGLSLGMGLIFALNCDIRTIAEDAQVGFVESGISVLAGAGGTQRLTRSVGTSRAMELLLEGSIFTAGQAVELGLAHHVFARDELHAQTMAIAQRLAHRTPAIVKEIKRSVYETATRPSPRSLTAEAAGFMLVLTSPASRPQLRAYADYLTAHHDNLSDAAVLEGWPALLDPEGHQP